MLLASGAAAKDGVAPLASVLAAADAIQHAIPTKDEMDGAIGRLARAGHLVRTSRGLELTPSGVRLFEQAHAAGKAIEAQQHALEVLLGAAQWHPGLHPSSARGGEPEIIAPQEWERLMARYRRP